MRTKTRQQTEGVEIPELTGSGNVPVAGGLGSVPAQTLLSLEQMGSMSRASRRDIEACFEEAKAVVSYDKGTAESCSYNLPRGGKTIAGPSVRLAEVMQNAWGNITVSIDNYTVETDDSGRASVKVWGWAVDTQKATGVQSFESATVYPKRGQAIADDDIANAIDRARALLYRDLVFKVIPRAYVNVVYNHAMTVALGSPDTKKRIDAMLSKFKDEHGVTEQEILTYLNKPHKGTLDIDDVKVMMGVYADLKDAPDLTTRKYMIEQIFRPREGREDSEPEQQEIRDRE